MISEHRALLIRIRVLVKGLKMARTSANSSNIHALIDQIYDSAVRPEKWPELLEALGRFTEDFKHEQKNIASALVSSTPSYLEKDEKNLSDMLKQIGSLSLTSADQEDCQDSEDLSNILRNHFVRALQIAQQLLEAEEQNEVISTLLDHMPIGLIVVDCEANMLQVNQQAMSIIDNLKSLIIRDNRLWASTRQESIRLHQAIKDASKTGAFSAEQNALVLSNFSNPTNELLLVVSCIAQSPEHPYKAIAIFVSMRKSQSAMVTPVIRDLYGLTNKEYEVTKELVRGLSIKEIAVTSKVQEGTVRNQVKSVMAKTNTKRQGELISLLLTGPGSLVLAQTKKNGSHSIQNFAYGNRLSLQNGKRKLLKSTKNKVISYQEYGNPKGIPLVFAHSSLGSSSELANNAEEILNKYNIRLIIPDRAGYGYSTSDIKYSLDNPEWQASLEQLLDHLAIDKFYFCGYALGAYVSMGVLHNFSDRIIKAALISTGLPNNIQKYYQFSSPLYRLLYELSIKLPKAFTMYMSIMLRGIQHNPERFLQIMSADCLEHEKEILFSNSYQTNLGNNIFDIKSAALMISKEIQMVTRGWPWNFDVSEIKIPIELWHGEEDNQVPIKTAYELAEALPNAESHFIPNAGHFAFFYIWEDVVLNLIT